MKIFFPRFFVFFVLILVFATTGCWLFDSNPSGPQSMPIANTGRASVNVKLVVPHEGSGTPISSLRASGAPAVVVRLLLGNPGNSDRPKDVLVKSADVGLDGSVTISFEGLPEHPCVGQLGISNGSFQGYKKFHGAVDLKAGENTLEMAPAGSKLPQDILAHVAAAVFESPDLMKNAKSDVVQTINGSISNVDPSSNNAYSDSVNKAIEVLRPSDSVYFAISNDKKSMQGFSNGVQQWENHTTDYFQSDDVWGANIADLSITEIIRQNLDGIGYATWKHDTLSTFLIGAISSDGTMSAFVKNPGVCSQILTFTDGSVVIGGTNNDKGCPVLFRWSGKTSGNTWSDIGGAENGLTWYYYFVDQAYAGIGDRPTIKGLQYDGVDTLIVTVDNVSDASTRTYNISLSNGALIDQQTEKPNNYPSIALTKPANEQKIVVGEELFVEAEATDTDGSIVKVEFFANGEKLGEDTTQPYSLAISSLSIGSYRIKARVTDDHGAVTESGSVVITIYFPVGVSSEIDLGDGEMMAFVSISSGDFVMGSPNSDPNSAVNEKPQRVVTISKSFYMGQFEVSQAQYLKIMGVNPAFYKTDVNLPVEMTTWFDAVSFCNKLSINQKLTPCYTNQNGSNEITSEDTVTCDWSANGYRLPTEAEWEYCCRAGTTTVCSCGDSIDGDYAWYYSNSSIDGSIKTHAVGSKLANPWNLYDMHGNIWEWCWDFYLSSYYSSSTGDNLLDPRGPAEAPYPSQPWHVARGAAFNDQSYSVRSATRKAFDPDFPNPGYGFRVMRVP